jgi:hypothetical protein
MPKFGNKCVALKKIGLATFWAVLSIKRPVTLLPSSVKNGLAASGKTDGRTISRSRNAKNSFGSRRRRQGKNNQSNFFQPKIDSSCGFRGQFIKEG